MTALAESLTREQAGAALCDPRLLMLGDQGSGVELHCSADGHFDHLRPVVYYSRAGLRHPHPDVQSVVTIGGLADAAARHLADTHGGGADG
jgi:hypothetical protein